MNIYALFHTRMKIDIAVKITKFLHITGIIDRTLKYSQVQKHTKLKLWHNLLYYMDAKLRQSENRINA